MNTNELIYSIKKLIKENHEEHYKFKEKYLIIHNELKSKTKIINNLSLHIKILEKEINSMK